jgi:PD-(D/E)XK nuclease superfamily protein
VSQRVIRVSPTSLDSIQKCLRLAYYSKILHLYPKEKLWNSDALDRGSFIHDLLARYYTAKKEGSDDSIIVDIINAARADILLDTDLPPEKVDLSIKAFASYILYYKSESWTVLEIEQPFSKVLYETEDLRIIMEGKIDLIVKSTDGKIQPVDHKSIERDSRPVSLKNQFIAYAWALDTNTLIENRIGLQKGKSADEKFTRHLHCYSADQINEWIEDAVYAIRRMDMAVMAGYFPGSYSHCWSCYYRPICESERQDRDTVINRDWEKGEGSELYAKDVE